MGTESQVHGPSQERKTLLPPSKKPDICPQLGIKSLLPLEPPRLFSTAEQRLR